MCANTIHLTQYKKGEEGNHGELKKYYRFYSGRKTQWFIDANDSGRKAEVLVGADGINSIVRKTVAGKIPNEYLSLTCGYILTAVPAHRYIMKFLDVKGYNWIFSRAHHARAGIGATLGMASGKSLF